VAAVVVDRLEGHAGPLGRREIDRDVVALAGHDEELFHAVRRRHEAAVRADHGERVPGEPELEEAPVRGVHDSPPLPAAGLDDELA
jgi:hypothetical protein